MADDLKAAITSSVAALRAQSIRLRIVSENLANAGVTAATAQGDPYVRKTVSFKEVLDRSTGASLVQIDAIARDKSPFSVQHDPGHPAADANGNVRMPNVNPLVELADMREGHRSYDASLQVIRQTREMIADLLELLRAR